MRITLCFEQEAAVVRDCEKDYCAIPVKAPGRAGILRIAFSIPVLDIQGWWTPDAGISCKLQWRIENLSGPQRNFPALAFFDLGERNRCLFAADLFEDDCRIYAAQNQEKAVYDVIAEFALSPESRDFTIVIDRRPIPWVEALAEWRDALRDPTPAFPAGAWEPVFCSWYAHHADFAQEDLIADAEIASRLGFRTLIIDDGWCIDERKRVSPETLVNWYRWIGDWEISRSKFHDFEQFRRRIRELDLKLLFWVAPFFVGTDSGFRKEFPGCCEEKSHEGSSVLKPRRSDALQAQLEKLERVMREGELDGLKVDFLDSIAPSPEAPAGRIVLEFVRSLVRRVRAVKPDALLEFRQPYANPCMIPCGTQFRAGDVPFDYLENFRRIAQIRLCMGDRVPVHADPAYWHPEESIVNVARHMIAAIAGVPMLSMKLTELSPCHTRVVQHFLDFYRDHRPTLNLGRWSIVYHLASPAYLRADGERESVVFLLDEARLAEALEPCGDRESFVLNLSSAELPWEGGEVWAPTGEFTAPWIIPPGGIGRSAARCRK